MASLRHSKSPLPDLPHDLLLRSLPNVLSKPFDQVEFRFQLTANVLFRPSPSDLEQMRFDPLFAIGPDQSSNPFESVTSRDSHGYSATGTPGLIVEHSVTDSM